MTIPFESEYYLAINQFMIDAQGALLDRAEGAPALIVYKFAGSAHELAAAYELYNDAGRYAEIQTKNKGYPWSVGPEIMATKV